MYKALKKTFFTILCLVCTVICSSVAFAKSNLVVVQQPASRMQGEVVELLVDFSGSMAPWIKQSISALNLILPKIDSNTNVGLRVFGQYAGFSSMFYSACTATSQTVILGKNKSAILSSLNSITTGGATPLTYALRQTVSKDFSGIPYETRKKIILVTDGFETCGGNPCAYIQSLARTRKDIVIDVILVGNSRNLSCLTDSTGGTLYNINDVESFRNSMAKSFDTNPEDVYNNSNYTFPDNEYEGEPILGY